MRKLRNIHKFYFTGETCPLNIQKFNNFNKKPQLTYQISNKLFFQEFKKHHPRGLRQKSLRIFLSLSLEFSLTFPASFFSQSSSRFSTDNTPFLQPQK